MNGSDTRWCYKHVYVDRFEPYDIDDHYVSEDLTQTYGQ